MKRITGLIFAGILGSSQLISMSYYALQVRGGSYVYAIDRPVQKGRVVLFHSYPDGTYMSLASSEVEKIVTVQKPPAQAGGLAPGETVYIGSALEGPGYQPTEPAAQPDAAPSNYGSGGYDAYMGWWGGGYFPGPRPPRPGPSVPSNIGSNGFPILAPPGSPGSAPQPIGPNGYPIIAPGPRQ